MRITNDWKILIFGGFMGIVGAVFSGNRYELAPLTEQIGLAVSMIGVSLVGCAAGMGRDVKGKRIKSSEGFSPSD